MRQSGSSLAQILEAGQWQSAAFMTYMDEVKLQKVAVSFCPFWKSAYLCMLKDVAFAVALDSDADSD